MIFISCRWYFKTTTDHFEATKKPEAIQRGKTLFLLFVPAVIKSLTDKQVKAIYAYLKSLPAVHHQVKRRS